MSTYTYFNRRIKHTDLNLHPDELCDGWLYDDAYGGIFRIWGFSGVILRTYEQAVAFVEEWQKQEKLGWLCHDWKHRLKKFFDEHPEGFIHFE